MNPMMNLIQERATFGAKWLDDMVEYWEEEIDPNELDMSAKDKCVLSHLYGDYKTGTALLGIDEIPSIVFGFHEDDPDLQRMLTEAWLEEVYKRI